MQTRPRNLGKGVFLDLETVDQGDLDLSGLEACLPAWEWHLFTGPAEIPGRVGDARVAVTNKCRLNREVLYRARELRLVAVAATGTDVIDLEAARERGVTVCNIRDYCTEAVAQHTVTLMLNLLTGQPWYWQRVREGEWSAARQFCLQDRPIREAAGLSFGVIGYGTLGKAAAAAATVASMPSSSDATNAPAAAPATTLLIIASVPGTVVKPRTRPPMETASLVGSAGAIVSMTLRASSW